jgi:hypothetical protein
MDALSIRQNSRHVQTSAPAQQSPVAKSRSPSSNYLHPSSPDDFFQQSQTQISFGRID